jgi:tetratricopeptide (TPR) repeat protein
VRDVGRRLNSYLSKIELNGVDFQRYFSIRVSYADALLHQAAITEGLQEFEDLYSLVRGGALAREDARDRFYHKYINANLHSGQFHRALSVLDERAHYPPADPEFIFLMYDRYGVLCTALGDVDSAEAWLDRALAVARSRSKPEWESIAYYDLAYIHVHVTYDKERAVEYFKLSLEAYERGSDRPAWRRIEKHSLCALVALIENRIEDAVKEVEEGLWLSKRESEIYSNVKLLNLLGVCQVVAERPRDARVAFELGRSQAAMSFNSRAFWRAIANLGALSALEEGPSVAFDYFAEVEQHLRRTVAAEHAATRELPILANYILVCSELGNNHKIAELLAEWKDDRLSAFARGLSGRQPRSWRRALAIVQHGGFGFLPT